MSSNKENQIQKHYQKIDEESLKVEYAAPTTQAEEIIIEAFEEVFNQKK